MGEGCFRSVNAEYLNFLIYSNIFTRIYLFLEYIKSFSVSRMYLDIHSYNL